MLRTDLEGHVSILGRRDGGYDAARGEQVASARGSGAERTGAGGSGDATGAAAGDAVIGAGTAVAGSGAAGSRGLRLRVHADAPGNDNRNPNEEYVVLENTRGVDSSIAGWTICDAASHCFRFPPGAVVAAGSEVGGGRCFVGGGRAGWNNDGDTATLRDRDGTTVPVFRY